MQITGTHFNYYLICHRKLWLFANGINMEHASEAVYEGKLIHETSYPQRPERFKEIAVEGIKIDWFDTKNNVVHEIKKSDKKGEAHVWQVKYYLYVLEKNGIEATGLLEYPKLRKTHEVLLSEPDREYIVEALKNIEEIIGAETVPAKLPKTKCKNCSYFDFCWSSE
ncbi:MAG: CRISPR-associated protein Cas4 [Prolixibacteraceae bacterium]|nr:CRISPR-associated protein Cas4 [Prolixibacteraceae bacterium]